MGRLIRNLTRFAIAICGTVVPNIFAKEIGVICRSIYGSSSGVCCDRLSEIGLAVSLRCAEIHVIAGVVLATVASVQLLLVTVLPAVRVCARLCACGRIYWRYLGLYVSSRLGHCGLYVASSAVHRSPRCKERERERGTVGEQRALYLFAPLYFLFKRYRR